MPAATVQIWACSVGSAYPLSSARNSASVTIRTSLFDFSSPLSFSFFARSSFGGGAREGDRLPVGRPRRRRRTLGQVGQLLRLAARQRQEIELRPAVGGPDERQGRAVG